MIILDTSAWIYYFRYGWPKSLSFDDIVICSPVAQEILQGIKDDFVYESIEENIVNMPMVANPLPYRMYREAADIYRNGRKRGLTIRSSIDCLIAAIAIEHKLPVMHNDRDFTMIAEFTSLQITPFIKV